MSLYMQIYVYHTQSHLLRYETSGLRTCIFLYTYVCLSYRGSPIVVRNQRLKNLHLLIYVCMFIIQRLTCCGTTPGTRASAYPGYHEQTLRHFCQRPTSANAWGFERRPTFPACFCRSSSVPSCCNCWCLQLQQCMYITTLHGDFGCRWGQLLKPKATTGRDNKVQLVATRCDLWQ